MFEPISIFIIAKDEERIIESCLKQASKLLDRNDDELILVDSGSTDRTVEIAEKYCTKVIHHDWEGYAKQKNFALAECKNKWVLSLDADEILTDELVKELESIRPKLAEHDAYKIARRLYIGEQFIRWGGYYPDYQLRLFKQEDGKFGDTKVHESVKLTLDKANVKKLRKPLDHYSYDTLNDLKKAFAKYARLANENIDASKKGSVKAGLKAVYTFLLKFFFRLGFLHGLLGFKLALIHASYTYGKWKD